ncbi:Uma2 family endonuclease [Streptomonospora halophila]|uniref:Uma2 family endonuclease n=2 Tax=Streptomonospora halophila TaxID=427369 RepID=A0ABP9GVU8_9ACTN
MSVATAEPSSAGAPEESPPTVEDTSLRSVAERMADMLPEGFRAEILEGSIVVSPTPRKKHGGVISRIQRQLIHRLPDDRDCYQVVAVGTPGDNADFAIPDLLVMPAAEAEADDGRLAAPDAVDLVLEVVSVRNAPADIEIKPRVYAGMGIAIYLLVDPRDGSVICYSDPREGAYQATHRMKFGDAVVLPEPLKDVRIETDDLPLYA